MEVIKRSAEEPAEGLRTVLDVAGVEVLGECHVDGSEHAGHHLLVADADLALAALAEAGRSGSRVRPPKPVTPDAVLWWKAWRLALSAELYTEFRLLHHDEVRSVGSLIRVRERDFPEGAEPWAALADGGVDIRCEFHCELPSGLEVHLLVPDAERATEVLEDAGFPVTPVDYEGPDVGPGISWWGQWKPALAYAGEARRPILLSFASPRVEQVPGVW